MRLKFKFLIASIAVSLLMSAASAFALRIAAPNRTPAQQLMTADVVVVGKVTEIEKEMTKAAPLPGATEKVDYQIAVLKIEEGIQGAKGLTNLRIGFTQAAKVNPRPVPPNGIQIQPAIGRIPAPVVNLTAGQEGCFFLTKHHDGDFYILQQFGQPLDKKVPDFDKQLGSVKKLVKVFENPKEALKDKDAASRQYAAVALVQKYRQYPQATTPNTKVTQEAIEAEESKLILTTLSEMEWKNSPDGMGLQNVFNQLQLQPKDGWTRPKVPNGVDVNKVMGEAVAKWMKENADKYRIQRYVAK